MFLLALDVIHKGRPIFAEARLNAECAADGSAHSGTRVVFFRICLPGVVQGVTFVLTSLNSRVQQGQTASGALMCSH